MPLHILKLSVGAESIGDLEGWIAMRLAERKRLGQAVEHFHTTRMVPKRLEELLDGGSLFWVIKGQVAARQRLLDIRPFTDSDGIGRCRLILDPPVTPVRPRPCRPFQGWRYMTHDTAPPDLDSIGIDLTAMPEPLRRELHELGLL